MIYNTNVGGGGGAEGGKEILLQADKSAFKAKKSIAAAKKAAAARGVSPARGGGAGGGRATPPPSALARNALDVDSMDFNKKILHLSWHPFEDTVAIAATNNVPSPFPPPQPTHNPLFLCLRLSLETDFSSSCFLLRRRNV